MFSKSRFFRFVFASFVLLGLSAPAAAVTYSATFFVDGGKIEARDNFVRYYDEISVLFRAPEPDQISTSTSYEFEPLSLTGLWGYNEFSYRLSKYSLTGELYVSLYATFYYEYTGEYFRISRNTIRMHDPNDDIYRGTGHWVVEVVPLPAAMPLLLAGLAGLGAVSVRKKRA